MGRELHSSLTILHGYSMRTLLLLTVLSLALLLVAAKKKPKGKPKGKPKPECGPKSVKLKNFLKYTETTGSGKNIEPVAGEQCWWDLNRNDCAKCKPGGYPCGFPMHQWCQKEKTAKKKGCSGIPENKYTLSTRGYPCYADPDSFDCAICTPGRIQCKKTGSKCGNYCGANVKDLKCDGVLQNCYN